tara:strand:+ start:5025 stop:5162 length:138 start_codon:yes stop_codon:yes gene_type:complete
MSLEDMDIYLPQMSTLMIIIWTALILYEFHNIWLVGYPYVDISPV